MILQRNQFLWSLLLFVTTQSSCFAWDPTGRNRDICTLDAHCLNDGKCMPANDETSFKHCHCQDGFSGPRCSKFCPYDCKNGGYCSLTPQGNAIGLEEQNPTYDPNDYMCKCFGRFTGPLCEIPYINCGSAERCYNGGSCVLGDDMKHTCSSCAKGFGGDSCETSVEVSEDATEEILTEEGKMAIMVLSILLFFLGIALWILIKRKRELLPKFIEVIDEEEDEDEEEEEYYHGYSASIFRSKENVAVFREKESHIGGVMLNVI